jgi:hypothetical protein
MHRAILSPPVPRGAWRASLFVLVAAAAMVIAAAPASSGNVPNWKLNLRVARWVAPSSFAATVVGQTAGSKVRRGLPVTLVLDRRTACSVTKAGAGVRRILCKTLRARVATKPSLPVAVTGQFETGHLGRIGFRARSVREVSIALW